LDISRDCRLIEKVQLLKLDVSFSINVFRTVWIGLVGAEATVPCDRDVSRVFFFPSTRSIIALVIACSPLNAATGTFAQCHPTLVNIGHLRGLDRFVAPVVVEHQKAFVGHTLYLSNNPWARKDFRSGSICSTSIFLSGAKLIFGQQILEGPR